jgi:hypothetical protein
VQRGFLGREFTGPPGVPVIDLKSGFLESGSPFEQGVDGDDVADIVFTWGRPGGPRAC